jgi:hypothetical protein
MVLDIADDLIPDPMELITGGRTTAIEVGKLTEELIVLDRDVIAGSKEFTADTTDVTAESTEATSDSIYLTADPRELNTGSGTPAIEVGRPAWVLVIPGKDVAADLTTD